jgi:hypothetical protein
MVHHHRREIGVGNLQGPPFGHERPVGRHARENLGEFLGRLAFRRHYAAQDLFCVGEGNGSGRERGIDVHADQMGIEASGQGYRRLQQSLSPTLVIHVHQNGLVGHGLRTSLCLKSEFTIERPSCPIIDSGQT